MREASRIFRSVGRSLVGLAAERLTGGDGLPQHARDASAGWMTAILQDTFPGILVKAVNPENQNDGTTNRARLIMEYDRNEAHADAPTSFFLKLPSAKFFTRLFTNLVSLGPNEVAFYKTIAPRIPVHMPRAYHAACTGGAQRFAILLEDLSLCGASFLDVTQPLSYETATLVMRELAALHAEFWDSPRLENNFIWLKSPVRNPTAGLERLLCSLALKPALRRYPGLIPGTLLAAAPRIAGNREKLDSLWARAPLTIIHGDAHAGNMYSLPGSVGLLDWQVVQQGQGMRDVSYFLTTSLDTELRRAHQRGLIKFYLSSLREKGIKAPEFEEAWRQYRIHALYAWVATMFTAAASTLQTMHIARTGLARTGEAVVDLDSIALMDELMEK